MSVTVESDEEKHPDDSAHQDEHLAPPTKDSSGSNKGERGGFGGKDISRRFERQSWRERHAEERRRLKHRFEVCVCVCVCVCVYVCAIHDIVYTYVAERCMQ